MTDSNTSHNSENRHDGRGARGEHPRGDGRARWAGWRISGTPIVSTASPLRIPQPAPRQRFRVPAATCPEPHVGSVSTAGTARHGPGVRLEPDHASGCLPGGGRPVPPVHSKRGHPFRTTPDRRRDFALLDRKNKCDLHHIERRGFSAVTGGGHNTRDHGARACPHRCGETGVLARHGSRGWARPRVRLSRFSLDRKPPCRRGKYGCTAPRSPGRSCGHRGCTSARRRRRSPG